MNKLIFCLFGIVTVFLSQAAAGNKQAIYNTAISAFSVLEAPDYSSFSNREQKRLTFIVANEDKFRKDVKEMNPGFSIDFLPWDKIMFQGMPGKIFAITSNHKVHLFMLIKEHNGAYRFYKKDLADEPPKSAIPVIDSLNKFSPREIKAYKKNTKLHEEQHQYVYLMNLGERQIVFINRKKVSMSNFSIHKRK
jgi:hypothetical protein